MRIATVRLGHIASRKMAGGWWCAAVRWAGSTVAGAHFGASDARIKQRTRRSRQNTPLMIERQKSDLELVCQLFKLFSNTKLSTLKREKIKITI